MFKSIFKVFCVATGIFNFLAGNIITGILLIGVGIYI